MADFKFMPGDEVVMKLSGRELVGKVNSSALTENMAVPRYYIEWVNDHGTVEGRWFDETELTHQSPA